MYQKHSCGCTPCSDAHSQYRRGQRGFTETIPLVSGLFVATFPYFGGLSPQRLRRILRMEVAALAEAQGVRLLSGELVVRIDRTGAGAFVSVAVDGQSERSLREVQQRAAELAWRHEQAHPQLAQALTGSLEEVAA